MENLDFPVGFSLSRGTGRQPEADPPRIASGDYCTYGRRRSRKERARGDSAVLRCMVNYALCRLKRSRGRPVALNQTEMAEYFSNPKPGARRGPSWRSISRWWPPFIQRMNTLGYRLTRAHDYGVDKRGRRRGNRLQSKLSWICLRMNGR